MGICSSLYYDWMTNLLKKYQKIFIYFIISPKFCEFVT